MQKRFVKVVSVGNDKIFYLKLQQLLCVMQEF